MSIFDNVFSEIKGALSDLYDFAGETANKAKCLAGYHQWSTWGYITAKDCKQRRSCRRPSCTQNETRTEHNWGDFSYLAKDDCKQKKQCKRCDQVEQRTNHQKWSAWKYVSEGGCDQARQCGRCSAIEKQITHIWGSWEFAGPTTCDKARYCRRCAEGSEIVAATESDHDFIRHQRINCYAMSLRCQRCRSPSSMPQLGVFHEYGPWMRDVDQDIVWRKCTYCGESQRQ